MLGELYGVLGTMRKGAAGAGEETGDSLRGHGAGAGGGDGQKGELLERNFALLDTFALLDKMQDLSTLKSVSKQCKTGVG